MCLATVGIEPILVFNHLKQARQREYDKPDSGVNGQTKLMQQDSHVMCVNGPGLCEPSGFGGPWESS
jgi:hypothetical protein